MTKDEYLRLFHKEQLNLVAFQPLFQCDDEVLRLVNAAIAAEHEACAQLVEHFDSTNPTLLAEAIRKRSEI